MNQAPIPNVGLRNQILTNTVGLMNQTSIPNVGLIYHTPTRCGLKNQIPTLRKRERPFHQKSSLSHFFLAFFKVDEIIIMYV